MLLNYKQTGHGHPIILIHGLFGSLDNLGLLAKALGHQFNVINVDMPDHGDSFYSKDFSYPLYAKAILDVLDHLKLDSAHILGHSMGGKVAMQLALDHPQRVSKLILADIAPVTYNPRHDNVFNALNSVMLNEISGRQEAMSTMLKHIEEPAVAQFLLKSLVQTDHIWRWKFNLSFLQLHYGLISQGIDSNSSYNGPVLFIKGGDSDYLKMNHQHKITSLFPNSKAKIIAGAGHWLHAQKPTIFNKIVLDFALD